MRARSSRSPVWGCGRPSRGLRHTARGGAGDETSFFSLLLAHGSRRVTRGLSPHATGARRGSSSMSSIVPSRGGGGGRLWVGVALASLATAALTYRVARTFQKKHAAPPQAPANKAWDKLVRARYWYRTNGRYRYPRFTAGGAGRYEVIPV